MVRRIIPALIACALAACQQPLVSDADLDNGDVTKPIHVERVRVQYAAAFPAGATDLPYDEALRLEAFLDQAGVRPHDQVFIAAPPDDSMAAARTGRIAAVLAQRSVGLVPMTPPPRDVAPNHLLILVDRFVATAPQCPNWSGSPATGHDNMPGSNFGCADANDLAEMVANPRDLMDGRTLGPADAEPTLDAILRYRTGAVKPLLSASQQGAPAAAPGAPGAPPVATPAAAAAGSGAAMAAPSAAPAAPTQ